MLIIQVQRNCDRGLITIPQRITFQFPLGPRGAFLQTFLNVSNPELKKQWLPLQVIFVLQELQSSQISLQHLEILDFLLKLFEEVPLKGCSLRGMEA